MHFSLFIQSMNRDEICSHDAAKLFFVLFDQPRYMCAYTGCSENMRISLQKHYLHIYTLDL